MDISVTAQAQMVKFGEVRRLNQSEAEPRPHRNRDEEILSWKLQTAQFGQNDITEAKTLFLSDDSHFCITPLEELKPIMLCDMKIPMIHRSRYLVCQVIGKPYSVIGLVPPSPFLGVKTLIEDLNGDVEEFVIFNFCYKAENFDSLPVGSILLVKEPWLQYSSKSKGPSLRIDSPSDIIFVDPTDSEFLTKIGAMKWYESMSEDAEFWQKEANECFKQEKFEDALKLYDRAIRYNPELPVLYLNKSITCIKIGAFNKAYEAAKLGLAKGGDREKALYRMGQAAYGMREWQKAANHFIECLKEFPKSDIAGTELKRTTARLAEKKYGKYDFKTMFLESQKTNQELDVADFKGPVQIAHIPGKGRGIIALKDIKEGTLLVVSKAFASGYSKDFPRNMLSQIRTTVCSPAQMMQIIKMMKDLQNHPERAKEVYDLYAGDKVQNVEIPPGVIDSARIQHIAFANSFTSDDWSLMMNNFNGVSENDENSHLFILPSYFNHSCIANAFRSYYGDVMAIHAITDIKKGEEIYLTYLYPLDGVMDRKEKLKKWPFTCGCKLCQLDAADEYCLKRNQILEEMKQYKKQKSPSFVIAKGEPLLNKIRESYANRKELKVVLAQGLVILSSAYFNTGNPTKSLKCLEEAVTLMDNPLKYAFRIADIRVNLGVCYLQNGNNAKFKEMIQKAMKLSFCADIEHFKMLYPEIAAYLS